ncbi:conserved protein of unknown function [Rhodovastum atsumiense]|uniref:Uncharacterized protein n=1 Tax=Rhodovastum atsumiense TaxID=504468 RepID=A0A5M6IQX0_9PROT|nr:hypothetical protein [Rhodovastum atsumiense]KAA5610581.1 hypothetical protein F1189_18305 [Rhodovastum atsumiense]CAH2600693.1 conserved protein of unknown function [Rhodovastum atsumiense]
MTDPTSPESSPPRDETEAVGAEAVLLEWLRAVRGQALADPAALRAWARADPAAFRAAFAGFAGMTAAAAVLDAAAGWLLGAGVRPDDRVFWAGDQADPALAGLAVTGAALVADPTGARCFDRAPAWPPAAPVRPPAPGPDGR